MKRTRVLKSDLLILGSATAAGGIPQELQQGLIQVAVGFITWLLTKLFDKTKDK